MALDAATLVNAGGGIAFMAAGGVAFVLARGVPPRSGHVPLGFALVAYGAAYVAANVIAAFTSAGVALMDAAQTPLFFAVAIGFGVFLVRGPWRVPANERLLQGLFAAAAALLVLWVAFLWMMADAAILPTTAGFASELGAALVALVAAERALAGGDARRTRALGALALGIQAFLAYAIGTNVSWAASGFGSTLLLRAGWFVVGCIPLLAVVFSWLAVTRAPGGRVGWLVSWGLLGMLLVGQVDPLGDSSPFRGIVRTIGALLVMFALTTGALDNGTRPAPAVRRSTMAASALALLFVVAQVAQNFLSTQYGLLMGGVVAGAFLFAAQPLQRAMERITERAPAPTTPHPAPATQRRTPSSAEAYRHALRAAMRDGHLSRREERHLAELARVLGIDAAQALDLREEIEREAKPPGS